MSRIVEKLSRDIDVALKAAEQVLRNVEPATFVLEKVEFNNRYLTYLIASLLLLLYYTKAEVC